MELCLVSRIIQPGAERCPELCVALLAIRRQRIAEALSQRCRCANQSGGKLPSRVLISDCSKLFERLDQAGGSAAFLSILNALLQTGKGLCGSSRQTMGSAQT